MSFARNDPTNLFTEIDTISHEKGNGHRQKQRMKKKADLGTGEMVMAEETNFVE